MVARPWTRSIRCCSLTRSWSRSVTRRLRKTSFYVVMGVTTSGEREILGIWAGDGAEGARLWLQVFSELKNRDVEDVHRCLRWAQGSAGGDHDHVGANGRQQCIVHLIRNASVTPDASTVTVSSRPLSRSSRPRASKRRRTGSPSSRPNGASYIRRSRGSGSPPALSSCRSWRYDVEEIRRVICPTNANESINARYGRARGPKRRNGSHVAGGWRRLTAALPRLPNDEELMAARVALASDEFGHPLSNEYCCGRGARGGCCRQNGRVRHAEALHAVDPAVLINY
ncbi:mutator family transposase [Arthrobacter sp. SLBN-100]|nr:mutator family transposase [Arthrobacter sp. SLBN-100]